MMEYGAEFRNWYSLRVESNSDARWESFLKPACEPANEWRWRETQAFTGKLRVGAVPA